MKHLEKDQQERLNETYQSNVKPEENPIFYGSRPMNFSRLSNGEQIKSALADKLSKTIETQLGKANKQFRDYRSRNARKNAINVCVVLNAKLDEFSPQIVMHSVHRKMKGSDGAPRFPYIDAVIYITEKHYQVLSDGRMAFAIGIYDGWGTIVDPWKDAFVKLLVDRWSNFRTGDVPVEGKFDGPQFDAVEDIPETMSRSDAWRLAYKRDPFLQRLTKQELIVYFNRCVALNSLTFIKGTWTKPSHEETARGMQRFTEVLEEINAREMDMREFSYNSLSPDDLQAVHDGLPAELVELLSSRHVKPSGKV
jgi:hypothetical protein